MMIIIFRCSIVVPNVVFSAYIINSSVLNRLTCKDMKTYNKNMYKIKLSHVHTNTSFNSCHIHCHYHPVVHFSLEKDQNDDNLNNN